MQVDIPGVRLRELRERAGITVTEMAEQLQVKRTSVYAAERAVRPRRATVVNYLAALDQLLERHAQVRAELRGILRLLAGG